MAEDIKGAEAELKAAFRNIFDAIEADVEDLREKVAMLTDRLEELEANQ
jgi:hypothetical protein